ncbi:MAG: LD-carboxypeptidase, partial [Desulfovibrionales bacterium]|nr:LD-carboxypeptidase [Desulfovibrionales bacterium]
PKVKGIIAARGGYGSMRLLEYLDWDLIGENPKILMGYSDVTALINAVVSHGSLGIHGPNLVSLSSISTGTKAAFFSCLQGLNASTVLQGKKVLVPGQERGVLMGGNLATLSHLCGTPFQPDFRGTILFIEDVGEPGYKIDRMLSQMKMAGMLDGLRGVVLGEFVDCEQSDYIPEIVMEIFDGIPILSGVPAGHGEDNFPLVMGETVVLDTAQKSIQWGDN